MTGVPAYYTGVEAVLLLLTVYLVTLQNAKWDVPVQQVVYGFSDDHVQVDEHHLPLQPIGLGEEGRLAPPAFPGGFQERPYLHCFQDISAVFSETDEVDPPLVLLGVVHDSLVEFVDIVRPVTSAPFQTYHIHSVILHLLDCTETLDVHTFGDGPALGGGVLDVALDTLPGESGCFLPLIHLPQNVSQVDIALKLVGVHANGLLT